MKESENVSIISESMYKINCLRGLMALWIIFGHCGAQFYDEPLWLLIIHKSCLIIVGLFFVLSGYGLESSLYQKENYLDGFLWKKIKRLFGITFFTWIFQIVLFRITRIEDLKYSISSMVINYLQSMNWYIYELLFFYVLFYFVNKVGFEKKVKLVFISTITVLIILILPNTDIVPAYYFSCALFH